MSISVLFRLSGVSLLLGGLLGGLAVAFHPSNMVDPVNVPVHLALYTAVMLIALGLPGLYARQADHAGTLGLAGLVALFMGLVFGDPIHSVLEFTVVPVLAQSAAGPRLLDGGPPGLMGPLMVAIPILLIGLLTTAITSFRAGVLPRWPAVVAVAAVFLVPVGFALSGRGPNAAAIFNVGPALVYLSMAAWGYVLIADSLGSAVVRRTVVAPA